MSRIVYGTIFSQLEPSHREDGEYFRELLTYPDRRDPLAPAPILYTEDFRFPSGLVPHICRQFAMIGSPLEVSGVEGKIRPPVVSADLLDGITLRPYQMGAIRKCLYHRRGIISIPTGGGKTEVYAGILASLDRPSLIIVGKINQAHQFYTRLRKRGFRDVGMIGDNRRDFDARHVVAISNSIYSGLKRQCAKTAELLASREIAAWDESHHVGAFSWSSIAASCPARHRFGFSATPFGVCNPYENFRDSLLIGLTEDVIFSMAHSDLAKDGYLAKVDVTMIRIDDPVCSSMISNWMTVRSRCIVRHETRNRIIATLAAYLAEDPGNKIVVIVEILEHGYALLKLLDALGIPSVFSHGDNQVTRIDGGTLYTDAMDPLDVVRQFEAQEHRVLIGSSVYDEGMDLPSVSDLILAAGGKSPRRLLQRIGRGMRIALGKDRIRVWDFFDRTHWIVRSHSYRRSRVYQDEGHEVRFCTLAQLLSQSHFESLWLRI